MTPVPGGQSGTCKRTGGCPRTFCTYQIGPPPTPQIPPPGAICPPPTPADGKISKPAAARRAGASGFGSFGSFGRFGVAPIGTGQIRRPSTALVPPQA